MSFSQSNMQADVVSPGMTTVITEVPLTSEQKLRNIEQVEDMKRRMLGG